MAVSCLTLGLLPIAANADKPEEKELTERTLEVQLPSIVEVRTGAPIQVYRLGEGGEFVLIQGDEAKVPEEVRQVFPKFGQGDAAHRIQVIGSVTTVDAEGKAKTIRLGSKKSTGLPEEVQERLQKAQRRIQEANQQMAEAQRHRAKAQEQMREARVSLKKLAAKHLPAVEVDAVKLSDDVQKAVTRVEMALDSVDEGLLQQADAEQIYRYTISTDESAVAKNQMPKEVVNQIQIALQQKAYAQAFKSQAKHAGMEAKLDDILSRLNKLETEIAELRSE